MTDEAGRWLELLDETDWRPGRWLWRARARMYARHVGALTGAIRLLAPRWRRLPSGGRAVDVDAVQPLELVIVTSDRTDRYRGRLPVADAKRRLADELDRRAGALRGGS